MVIVRSLLVHVDYEQNKNKLINILCALNTY